MKLIQLISISFLFVSQIFAQNLDESKPVSTPNNESKVQTQSSTHRRDQVALKLFNQQAKLDYALALEFKDQGKYKIALRRFIDFRTLYGQQSDTVISQIVDLYERLSLPDKALAELKNYFDQTVASTPMATSEPLYLKKADLEYRLGFWSDSKVSYQSFLSKFPNSESMSVAKARLQEISAAQKKEESQPPITTETQPMQPSNQLESSLDSLGEGLDSEN